MFGRQPNNLSATIASLPETPEYHAMHEEHDVQRMYRLRYAMKLSVFPICKDAKNKRRPALAVR
jgi:hypothetical protein